MTKPKDAGHGTDDIDPLADAQKAKDEAIAARTKATKSRAAVVVTAQALADVTAAAAEHHTEATAAEKRARDAFAAAADALEDGLEKHEEEKASREPAAEKETV